MVTGTRKQAGGQGTAPRGGPLLWVLVLVAIALVGTILLAAHRRRAAREAAVAPHVRTPVPASVMADLQGIPDSTWARVGTARAAPPTFVGDSDRVGGKPVVLYIGAGYCPYCAAARWSMIAALSRFGTFSGLTYAASSVVDVFPGTPTFSFYGARYASPYVEFQSVELESDEMLANGRYVPLETPTLRQQALLETYDVPPYVPTGSAGGIPFILVAGCYMWSGSPFSPGLLADRTQAEIAATLPAGSADAARAILAYANELTATICASDGNRPAQVCAQPAVRDAIRALPSSAP